MSLRFRHAARCLAASLLGGCGFVGIELRDLGERTDGDASRADAGQDLFDAETRDGQALASDGQTTTTDARSGGPDASEVMRADADVNDAGGDSALPSPSDAGGDASVVANGPCDLSGTWAAKVTVAVSWPAGTLQAGSGTIAAWLRYTAQQDGNIVSGSLTMCGFTQPDFGLASETYAFRFDDTMLFDPLPARVAVPDTTLTFNGTRPGDPFMLGETSLLIGAQLGVVWPPSAQQYRDTDMDGQQAVTVSFLNDGTHVYPRINASGSQRADRGYLASWIRVMASGTVTTCNEVAGPAAITYFNQKFIGCRVSDGSACTTNQANQLDAQRPSYLSQGATMRAIKVLPYAGCAFIRSAL